MIAVSNDFKQAMKQPVKELDAYIKEIEITIDETTGEEIITIVSSIASSDDLISFKVSCDSDLCKTAMRKVEAKFLGEHNLLDKWVHIGFGVKLPNSTYEYLDYGTFLVTETSTTKETGVTTIIGYDKMINSMKEYETIDLTYPIGLYNYTTKLCDKCDLELGNESFLFNNNLSIEEELWENINGITYRDIFEQIAQITGTTCIISNDDKVYFKRLTDTNEELTYDNMKTWKLEPLYGEINKIVLARTPQEDLVVYPDNIDEDDVIAEWRIENNEIIDDDRESVKQVIYDAMHGINYYPFEITTEGLGWYEIADNFDIVNDSEDVFNTSLFNFSITIDGGIKETLKTIAPTKTQSQYQYATNIDKRIRNTELIVDKQNQQIESLIEEMDGQSTRLTQTIEDFTFEVDSVRDEVENLDGIATSLDTTNDNTGTSQIKTTVKINSDGINVSSDNATVSTQMTSEKFEITNGDTILAYFGYDNTANTTVAEMDNLTVPNYFVTGYHRFEKFDIDNEQRTGVFYIGE